MALGPDFRQDDGEDASAVLPRRRESRVFAVGVGLLDPRFRGGTDTRDREDADSLRAMMASVGDAG